VALSSSRTCQSCSKTYTGTPTQTATGRWVCPDCAEGIRVAALTMMNARDDAAPVGEDVGLRGWLRLRRRPRGED
jgi:hypothetical protein